MVEGLEKNRPDRKTLVKVYETSGSDRPLPGKFVLDGDSEQYTTKYQGRSVRVFPNTGSKAGSFYLQESKE